MTAFLPSTRVTVTRSAGAVDAWGDQTAAVMDTVATAVPAAVVERRQRTYQGTEARGGVVETFTVRLRPGTDVREGDRLTTTDGRVFVVDVVSTPDPVIGLTDVRVEARRIAAFSAVNA